MTFERWFPTDPEPSARRLRKHALADELRALIGDLVMLDVEGSSEADLAELEERGRPRPARRSG